MKNNEKNNNKRKRTFSVSKTLLEKLNIYKDCTHIDLSTLKCMAVYHGIEMMKHGYYPYRNPNLKEMQKERCEIWLPKETWDEFDIAKDYAEQQRYMNNERLESIPDGELVEMFIRMEIKEFLSLVNEYVNDDDIDDGTLFDGEEDIQVTIKFKLPKILKDELVKEKRVSGLVYGKLYNYFIMNALFKEYTNNRYEVIDSDADLIKFIRAHGLNEGKALFFLKNLVKSQKIRLIYDKSIDY